MAINTDQIMGRLDEIDDTLIIIGRALRIAFIELIEDFDAIDFGTGFDDFQETFDANNAKKD